MAILFFMARVVGLAAVPALFYFDQLVRRRSWTAYHLPGAGDVPPFHWPGGALRHHNPISGSKRWRDVVGNRREPRDRRPNAGRLLFTGAAAVLTLLVAAS